MTAADEGEDIKETISLVKYLGCNAQFINAQTYDIIRLECTVSN
jgi:hypothetical protein